MKKTQLELIRQALLSAHMLVSDLRDAHKAACDSDETSQLIEMLLRPLLTDAVTIAATLNQLEALK